MRYEFDTDVGGYKFKLFIENADSNHNGIYTNYYKKRWDIANIALPMELFAIANAIHS